MTARAFLPRASPPARQPPAAAPSARVPRSGRGEYRLAAGVVAVVTAIGLVLPDSYYLSLGLVYLLTVILLSLRVGRGPLLMAGLLSAGTWDYVFIPPHFHFQISSVQDGLLVGTYLVVALVSGQFAARIRAQAVDERLRKERATALFNLTRTLTEKQTLPEAVSAALRQADELFSAQSSLLLAEPASGRLTAYRAGLPPLAAPELAAAEWAFRHRQSAGRSTPNPRESAGTYLPLLCVDHAVGVLGLTTAADLTPAQHELLEAFAHQQALIVEREYLRTANEREKLLAESEKLHRALLDSVSHELRTPLAVHHRVAGAPGRRDRGPGTRGPPRRDAHLRAAAEPPGGQPPRPDPARKRRPAPAARLVRRRRPDQFGDRGRDRRPGRPAARDQRARRPARASGRFRPDRAGAGQPPAERRPPHPRGHADLRLRRSSTARAAGPSSPCPTAVRASPRPCSSGSS